MAEGMQQASDLRRVLQKVVTKEINKQRPDIRVGRVWSVDLGAQIAQVLFPGNTNLVPAHFGLDKIPTTTIVDNLPDGTNLEATPITDTNTVVSTQDLSADIDAETIGDYNDPLDYDTTTSGAGGGDVYAYGKIVAGHDGHNGVEGGQNGAGNSSDYEAYEQIYIYTEDGNYDPQPYATGSAEVWFKFTELVAGDFTYTSPFDPPVLLSSLTSVANAEALHFWHDGTTWKVFIAAGYVGSTGPGGLDSNLGGDETTIPIQSGIVVPDTWYKARVVRDDTNITFTVTETTDGDILEYSLALPDETAQASVTANGGGYSDTVNACEITLSSLLLSIDKSEVVTTVVGQTVPNFSSLAADTNADVVRVAGHPNDWWIIDFVSGSPAHAESVFDAGSGSGAANFDYDFTVVSELATSQTISLKHSAIKESIHVYWGGGFEFDDTSWELDPTGYTVTVLDPLQILKPGRRITVKYAWDENVLPMLPVTMDIPATVLSSYNHAGSSGGYVGGTGCLGVNDGDGSYVWGQFGGGNGGTWGWNIGVKFPATIIPGKLLTTSLVVVSKGKDARTVSAPYAAAHGFKTDGWLAQVTRRDADEYNTYPDYGYIDSAYWVNVDTESPMYTTDMSPVGLAIKAAVDDTSAGVNPVVGMGGKLESGSGPSVPSGTPSMFRTDSLRFTLPPTTETDIPIFNIQTFTYGGFSGLAGLSLNVVLMSTDEADMWVWNPSISGSAAVPFRNTSTSGSWTHALGSGVLADVLAAGCKVLIYASGETSDPATSGVNINYLTVGYDSGYVECVTPLQFPYGVGGGLDPKTVGPFVEYISQEMIELGHVEYNPGSGFAISELYQGDSSHPGDLDGDMRITYVALRVTYQPNEES